MRTINGVHDENLTIDKLDPAKIIESSGFIQHQELVHGDEVARGIGVLRSRLRS